MNNEILVLEQLGEDISAYNKTLEKLSELKITKEELKEFLQDSLIYLKNLEHIKNDKVLLSDLSNFMKRTIFLLDKYQHTEPFKMCEFLFVPLATKLIQTLGENKLFLNDSLSDNEQPNLSKMNKQQRYEYYFKKALKDMKEKIIQEGDRDLESLAIEDVRAYIYSQGQIRPSRKFREHSEILFEAAKELNEQIKAEAKVKDRQLSLVKAKKQKKSTDEVLEEKMNKTSDLILEANK